ncbi:peptide deformylase [Candidatus Methylacidithermus pantelleriae]|uniref:Peptide deformylase n=1 Tax=Candidatus Methylacidithermus pantelleriae TaxID=2744239 RepID=A0A8J2BRA8_9BACT|nr:peptide deformylase [Candidatus Methylacidithermus pantelleriae]CAF0701047.1 Peptide deformylase [Candidatus Methylacidithermus pantelleriae]
MILPIVLYGNPILRKKGEPVQRFDDTLRRLAQDMVETMHAHKGVGLAAQQVGVALQVAVIDVRGVTDRPSSFIADGKKIPVADWMPLVLINPKLELTKSKEPSEEGCLSFPGLRLTVPRARRVLVRCQDLEGRPLVFEASGFLSIVIQHEWDHLMGRLFIDYLDPMERQSLREILDKIREGTVLPPA